MDIVGIPWWKRDQWYLAMFFFSPGALTHKPPKIIGIPEPKPTRNGSCFVFLFFFRGFGG